jgi:transcriptional regulator with XRE-family HTH domain
MKGSELKSRLEELGFTKAFIADKLGVPAQNVHIWLRAEDVKTGTIEKLSEVLEIPISVFYGEAYNKVNVSGNNNATATGNNNTVSNSDDRLLTLLLNKDEQLNKALEHTTIAMEQTTRALMQSTKSQEQLDEVIELLKKV